METAVIIKPNGDKQRIDVALTAEIANALVKKVLAGETMYPEEGYMTVSIGEGETRRTEEVRVGTLTTWITRNVVIPGDGRTLRSALDEAREERKSIVREQRQKDIIENAEQGLAELVRIPIKSGKQIETRFRRDPVTGVYNATGKTEIEFEGVNPKLAEAKIKALTFGLERLDAPKYASKSSVQNTHMVFSLSELRRVKERRDELAAQHTPV